MDSNDESHHYNLTGLQVGIAGATSGVVTRFLAQPLDVIKIRFQLQITPIKVTKDSKYSSIFQAIRLIVKEEGLFGLWKGHIPAQYLSVVFGAVQFSTFEMLNSYFHKTFPHNHKKFEHLINIGTGSVAGLSATVASFPFDVVRTYLVFQTEPKIYNGMVDVATKIYKKEGIRGFSRGINSACFQTVPMSGLIFCFHGIFTQSWLLLFHQTDISTTGSITTGLLSGLCAKTIVYPFDLMKKRLQIQGFNEKKTLSRQMYKCSGLIQCFLLTINNEGFLGLFKGFYPSILKAGATSSIYFTVYDKVCKILQYSER